MPCSTFGKSSDLLTPLSVPQFLGLHTKMTLSLQTVVVVVVFLLSLPRMDEEENPSYTDCSWCLGQLTKELYQYLLMILILVQF